MRSGVLIAPALASSALAGVVAQHQRRQDVVPTVHIPLHYYYGVGHKIATNLELAWSNTTIEVCFDQGSENFWVFGPDSVMNWGCNAFFCQGPCNQTAEPVFDYRLSPTAAPAEEFESFYAYGGYTKTLKGRLTVNDTLVFAGESGLTSSVEGVRVALEDYMQQRLPSLGTCPLQTSYDRGILGTAPFSRSASWNTTGPHVRQELLERGVIRAPVQSMWFDEAPQEWNGTFTGNAVFGGIETSKFSGSLVKVLVVDATLDNPGASVGYHVKRPTVSAKGVAMKPIEGRTSCHIDSGTQIDDLPITDADALRAALGLGTSESGATVWPGPCDSIPADLTVDLHFEGAEAGSEGVTIKVPVRNYARNAGDGSKEVCSLNLDTGGCMLAAPFSTAAYFAADDARGEVALAQGGVSKRGSEPDQSAMSLTIP